MTEVDVFGNIVNKVEPFPPKLIPGEFKVSVIIPAFNQEKLVLKALSSIPKRIDVEVIAIDDGSTDNTHNNMKVYQRMHPTLNLKVLSNERNMGVAYTVNRGYDLAKGNYVVLLGSDDYFYTSEFERAMSVLDGTDLVYFDLEVNDGTIWKLNQKSKSILCGSVKFIKRSFLGNTRCPENVKAREDYFFYRDLLKKNPTEKFTHLVVKHYNYPRNGSLSNLASKGEI